MDAQIRRRMVEAALILKRRAKERWNRAETLEQAMLAYQEDKRADEILRRYGGENSGIDEKSAAAQS